MRIELSWSGVGILQVVGTMERLEKHKFSGNGSDILGKQLKTVRGH
jgi:hypothetical protein